MTNLKNDPMLSVNLENQLIELRAQAKDWEINELSRSNNRLFEILTKCFDIWKSLQGKPKSIEALKTALRSSQVRIQSNTSVPAMIIKMVFESDRRRASSYAITLQRAQTEKIEPHELTDWIIEQGGIEEIRRNKPSQHSEPPAQKRNRRVAAAKREIDFQKPKLTTHFNGVTYNRDFPYTLLFGVIKENGEVQVMSAVPDSTKFICQTALEKFGAEIEKRDGKEALENAQIEDSAELNIAIEAAAASSQSNPSDSEMILATAV